MQERSKDEIQAKEPESTRRFICFISNLSGSENTALLAHPVYTWRPVSQWKNLYIYIYIYTISCNLFQNKFKMKEIFI